MLARLSLAHLPTPLEPMPRLTAALGGPTLWIKRDDQSGLAGGGNKTRKLEFLVADALQQGADTLITAGAAQSNHCRQTAAAAARQGLRCVLVLGGAPPIGLPGNLLLDDLLGATLVWTGGRSRERLMEEQAAAARAAGHTPYVIPVGGSNPIGAAGYALAMLELKDQMAASRLRFNRVVFASSSGGTHAGLAVGARLANFQGEVLGISIDASAPLLRERVSALATATASLIGEAMTFEPAAIAVNADFLGGGYGVMGVPERQAIQVFAQTEGLLLDPVYTGRAAAGLLDLIRRRIIPRQESVLFWHTGGQPALFAYGEALLKA